MVPLYHIAPRLHHAQAQQEKYDKYLRMLMKTNPAKLVTFVESMHADRTSLSLT